MQLKPTGYNMVILLTGLYPHITPNIYSKNFIYSYVHVYYEYAVVSAPYCLLPATKHHLTFCLQTTNTKLTIYMHTGKVDGHWYRTH